MLLSNLAAIGSLVSGIAVLISLVYLSLQVKQAERNQQASIRQGRASRTVEINLAGLEPSVADAFQKGMVGAEDITRTQWAQFARVWSALLFNAEESYFQHSEGLLAEPTMASLIAGWRRSFASPGVRAFWKSARSGYEIGFVNFMDKIMSEVAVSPPNDPFVKWQADVAAEKSRALQ